MTYGRNGRPLGKHGIETLMAHSTGPEGYPVWGFELFYQQGLRCFLWKIPRYLVKQAFRAACDQWKSRGQDVRTWQIRAFVYGCTGDFGVLPRRVKDSYAWPTPPDPSWRLVVCVYPDGTCDLDLVHPVSRRFYSEDNGPFEPPSQDTRIINWLWYEEMGFEIFRMQPYWPGALKVGLSPRQHLSLAKD